MAIITTSLSNMVSRNRRPCHVQTSADDASEDSIDDVFRPKRGTD